MALANAQSLSKADAVMMEVYDKKVAHLPELKTPMSDRVKAGATTVKINQKGRVKPFTSDFRMQIKGGNPDMDYPIGSDWKRGRWRVTPVKQVATYAIDDATYEDYTRGDENTFVDLAMELKEVAAGFAYYQEVFLGGDGSGALATVKTGLASGNATVAIDDVPDGTHAKAFGVEFLRRNVDYEVRATDGTFRQYIKILDTAAGINYSTNQITLTANTTVNLVAGDRIYFKDSYGYAMHGFSYLFQGGKTGWWQGYNCNGEPNTNTPYYNAGGRSISNAAIEAMLQAHAFRDGDGFNATFKFYASPSLISIFKTAAWGMKRLSNQDSTYNAGVKDARYEDSMFVPAPKFDPDAIYGADFTDLFYLEQTKLGPIVVDSQMWHQSVGAANYGAGTRYMQYGKMDQYAIDQPQKHVVGRNFDVTGSKTIANFRQ